MNNSEINIDAMRLTKLLRSIDELANWISEDLDSLNQLWYGAIEELNGRSPYEIVIDQNIDELRLLEYHLSECKAEKDLMA